MTASPPPTAVGLLLREWAIFRRQLASYPENHPLLQESGQRLADRLQQQLDGADELRIGAGREGFLLGEDTIGKEWPPVVQFSRDLLGRGVAGIGVRSGVTAEEIATMTRLTLGGADAVRLADLDVSLTQELPHIQLALLDYSAIETTDAPLSPMEERTDTPPEEFWRRLVQGAMDGSYRLAGEQPVDADQLMAQGRQLAQKVSGNGAEDEDRSSRMGPLLQQLQEALPQREPLAVSLFLTAFFQALAPELRHRLLSNAAETLGEANSFLIATLRRLPPPLLGELLRMERSLNPDKAPPLLKILERLQHKGPAIARQRLEASPEAVERLHTLMREDTSELFTPDDYQQTLDRLQRAPGGANLMEQLAQLKETLDSHRVESKLCAVILEVARHLPAAEQTALLSRNLREICSYFLELGDFAALIRLYDQLRRNQDQADAEHKEVAEQALEAFQQPDFVDGVLAAIQVWGKPRYEEVKQLLLRIGRASIDPLLDRLADEEKLSLRRYYMECLTAMGRGLRPFLLARLDDSRWYFLRNLVVLLRELNDPEVLQYLEPLREHSHIRVRQEVLRTFLHYDDQRAVRALLQQMAGPDTEEQLTAIRMAGKSRSPAIQRRLSAMLSPRDLSTDGLRIQSALLSALAEIGEPTTVPVLRRLFRRWNLWHPRLMKQLRVEIVRSLGGYPAAAANSWLEQLARHRDQGIVEAAQQARKQQRRKS